MSAVHLFCLSRKPGPSRPEARSAVRQLLRVAHTSLEDAGLAPGWTDLRDLDFPTFDGRGPDEYGPVVEGVVRDVTAARLLVLGVPSYWGSPSGYAKNFLDVLGGAAYDTPSRTTALAGTAVACVVVGGRHGDGHGGLAALRHGLGELGALVLPHHVVVDDPRTHPDLSSVVRDVYHLARRAAVAAGLDPAAPAVGKPVREEAVGVH